MMRDPNGPIRLRPAYHWFREKGYDPRSALILTAQTMADMNDVAEEFGMSLEQLWAERERCWRSVVPIYRTAA